jgi:hypothetical protein
MLPETESAVKRSHFHSIRPQPIIDRFHVVTQQIALSLSAALKTIPKLKMCRIRTENFIFYKVDGSSVGGPLAGTATPHRTDIIFVPPHGQFQLLAASVCLGAASFNQSSFFQFLDEFCINPDSM